MSYLNTTDTSYRTRGKRKKFKLAMCWTNMKQRANSREDCEVFEEWQTYAGFRIWAINNGYKEGLALCRTGDVGDYKPDNVRWDTLANNMIEANSKIYRFVLEDKVIRIYNLALYCKTYKLNASHMSGVHNGRLAQHKGYTKHEQQLDKGLKTKESLVS